MAPDLRAVSITIYNKSWSIVLSIPSWDFYDDNTVWEVLEDSRVVALWITEISTAQWWTAAPHSNSLHNYTQSGTELNIVFYDVTPTPSTLTSHGHIDTLHMRRVQKTIKDYSAMRGPCPEGFHLWYHWYVSSESRFDSEWGDIVRIFNGLWLGVNKDNVMNYLKMPAVWYRSGDTGNRVDAPTRWAYYLLSKTTRYNGGWWLLYDPSVKAYSISSNIWWSIRPFKDIPVTPDNSWTVLYDWSSVATNAWIFWSQWQWLISLSADGTNWKTISDKNLWATVVYNNWDSISESNAWNFFQSWNCYWFPFSGTIKTSTTTVDASGYWPWNYYYSDTFIKWQTQARQSSSNENLWWCKTWPKTVTVDRREPVYYGPEITLLSYEEIIAMAGTDKAGDIVDILNEHPLEYYNNLSSEWHLKLDNYYTWGLNGYVILDTNNYIMYFGKVTNPKEGSGSGIGNRCNDTHIWYIPSTWLRDYLCDNEPHKKW